MAFKDLPPEGKEAMLNLVRALARRRARLDYADEFSGRKAPPDPAATEDDKPTSRRIE